MGENSFLDVLKEYFSKLEKENIFKGSKNEIKLPFEWLATEKLDRSIIQKALVSIFERDDTYRESAIKRGHNPDIIENFNIQFDKQGNAELFILGANKWSKLLIAKEINPDIKIPQITEKEFINKIAEVLNEERLREFDTSKMGLSKEAEEYVQTAFAKILNSPQVINDPSSAMCNLAENLVKYYEYMLRIRNNSDIHYGAPIKRREDEQAHSKKHKIPSSERKSEIYPFIERNEIFMELNPEYRIINGSIEDGGKIKDAAFTTYVFKNPRDKQGYLCVCEPLEGTHETRMFFIPKEKFDEYVAKDSERKLDEMVASYIEMSNSEFHNERFTKAFKHNDIENFKQRVQYMITGEQTSLINKHKFLYEQYDKQLFEGEFVSHKDIKGSVSKANGIDLSAGEKIIEGLDLNIPQKEEESK